MCVSAYFLPSIVSKVDFQPDAPMVVCPICTRSYFTKERSSRKGGRIPPRGSKLKCRNPGCEEEVSLYDYLQH